MHLVPTWFEEILLIILRKNHLHVLGRVESLRRSVQIYETGTNEKQSNEGFALGTPHAPLTD